MFYNKKILNKLENIENKVEIYVNKKHSFFLEFLSGVFRGFGISVGLIVFGAVIILILKQLVTLPLIGEYIAQIIQFVELSLSK